MDYHAVHGYDIASFDTSDSHRLPSISASQALDDLSSGVDAACIPTGLGSLDAALCGEPPTAQPHRGSGVKRGQITELWGPPGAGKAALSMQLAAHALSKGEAVAWVDCFQQTSDQRMKKVAAAFQANEPQDKSASVKEGHTLPGIHRYTCLSLPHFMALVSHAQSGAIPAGASLLVINHLSALINSTVPKPTDVSGAKSSKGPTPITKRLQAVQSITMSLQKLAVSRNCAVVVVSQCATKMHETGTAELVPAISTPIWDQSVSTRIAVYRDWTWTERVPLSIHIAALQRVDGQSTRDLSERLYGFQISDTGVYSVKYDSKVDSVLASYAKRKRGSAQSGLDNEEEEEDYGWANEDEDALPALPPQWQGSEDLMLGHEIADSDGDLEEHQDDAESDVGDPSAAPVN